jgi:hypothetical protein
MIKERELSSSLVYSTRKRQIESSSLLSRKTWERLCLQRVHDRRTDAVGFTAIVQRLRQAADRSRYLGTRSEVANHVLRSCRSRRPAILARRSSRLERPLGVIVEVAPDPSSLTTHT